MDPLPNIIKIEKERKYCKWLKSNHNKLDVYPEYSRGTIKQYNRYYKEDDIELQLYKSDSDLIHSTIKFNPEDTDNPTINEMLRSTQLYESGNSSRCVYIPPQSNLYILNRNYRAMADLFVDKTFGIHDLERSMYVQQAVLPDDFKDKFYRFCYNGYSNPDPVTILDKEVIPQDKTHTITEHDLESVEESLDEIEDLFESMYEVVDVPISEEDFIDFCFESSEIFQRLVNRFHTLDKLKYNNDE